MTTRDEAVRLRLIDAGFSTGMAKQAAAAALLNRELDRLDGTNVDVERSTRGVSDEVGGLGKQTEQTTRSTKEYTLEMAVAEERSRRFKKELRDQAKAAIDAERALDVLGDDVDRIGDNTRRAGADIDRFSGRLRILADVAAILGPSLVPIGAVAIPAISGLASQFGFAAVGAGSLVAAAQGVGDALKAVNDAALDPTAANLEKAREAMEAIGPEAQDFVLRFQELRPVLRDIRDAAAAGWFPGLTESLDNLEAVAPSIERIFEAVGGVGGNLAAEGSAWFMGEQGQEFLSFVEREAPDALDTLGRTVGNLAAGMAEMWMAFDPLNDDFADWLLDISRRFNDWASNLSQTQGFEDFVNYIRTSGPQVAETFSALGSAVSELIQALAPLGGPSLQIIESFADAVAAISRSDLGTPILAGVSALALYNRSLAVTVGLQRQVAAFGIGGAAGGAKGAAAGGALGGPVGLGAAAGIVGGIELSDRLGRRSGAQDVQFSGAAGLASALQASNIGKYGDDLGIDLSRLAEDLGNAAEGGEYVNQVIAELNDQTTGASGAVGMFASAIGGIEPNSEKAIQVSEDLRNIIEGNSGALGENGTIAREMAEALGSTVSPAREAADAERARAAALQASAAASLSAFSATTSYREALKAAREQAKGNKAGIDGMSEAALMNRRSLEQLSASYNGLSDRARSNVKRTREMRDSFIETAVAMGVPEERATRLANRLMDIPAKVRTKLEAEDVASAKVKAVQRLVDQYGVTKAEAKALLDDAASGKINSVQQLINQYGMSRGEAKALLDDLASGKLRDIIGLLNSVDGRNTKSTHTHTSTTINRVVTENIQRYKPRPGDGTVQADGSVLDFYANGGMRENHVAQIAPTGAWRVWAEPETGGEAYIPLAASKRDRSLDIWRETGRRLGALESYANGAIGNAISIRKPGSRDSSDFSANDIVRMADNNHFKWIDRLEFGFYKLERALDKSERALDKERNQRSRLVDARNSLSHAVSNRLRSDVFADGGDVWRDSFASGSFGDVLGTLRDDIREGRAFTSATKKLKRKGLDGPALQALLAEGDPMAFAELSRSDLRQYEQLYEQRQRVTRAAGNTAGNAVYAKEIRQQTRELKDAKRELKLIKRVIKEEHREDRKAAKRGAGKAARGRRR